MKAVCCYLPHTYFIVLKTHFISTLVSINNLLSFQLFLIHLPFNVHSTVMSDLTTTIATLEYSEVTSVFTLPVFFIFVYVFLFLTDVLLFQLEELPLSFLVRFSLENTLSLLFVGSKRRHPCTEDSTPGQGLAESLQKIAQQGSARGSVVNACCHRCR